MTAQLLRGAPVAKELQAYVIAGRERFETVVGSAPTLVTVLVGDHPAAQSYRASIARTSERVGIVHWPETLAPTTKPDQFVDLLHRLNHDSAVTGILVLMPLPAQLSQDLVLEHLAPLKDVDGITPTNAGRLHLGLPSLRPSTPQGGIVLLNYYGIDPRGLDAVVIGRSNVVGRPLASLLLQRNATVTLCHRQTRDLAAVTRRADLVALAAGSPGLLTGAMLKPNAIVIDFGVNVVGNKLVGDADLASVREVAAAVTPVPGGTGPVTALTLMSNVIAAGFAAHHGHLDYVSQPELF